MPGITFNFNLNMKHVLLLALCLLAASTAFAQKFSTKQGGHVYTLDIPDYMTRTYELNDVATLQYYNNPKEIYTVVIDDSKDHLESLGIKFASSEDFLNDFVADYKTEFENRKLGKVKTFTANGNNHAQVELTWTEDDQDLYMLITMVESKSSFYKILSWTLAENKKQYKPDLLTIASSLKD